MSKPFKNTNEQISILKERGLTFSDIKKSEMYLFKNNYYNVINCYSKFLEDTKDHYIKNSNFSEIVAIHIFDSELKNILLKYIIYTENHFKSVLAYSYSKNVINQKYPYLNQSNYENLYIRESVNLIADLNKLIQIENTKIGTPINHYIKVHKDIPLWVLINFMTFGQAIKLFNYSKNTLKHSISRSVNTLICYENNIQDLRLSQKELYIILDSIKNLRNVLAHNNKIFNYKARYNLPYIKELHSKYNIEKNYPWDDVYSIFIILRLFLNESDFNNMNNAILESVKQLRSQLNTISVNVVLSSIGFPIDWDLKFSQI